MNMANNEKDFDEADWPDWIRWDLLEFKDSDSKELASSDARCLQDEDEYQEGHYHDYYDSENEATIKMTEEVLQRHRRKSPLPQPVHRSGKRGISPEPHLVRVEDEHDELIKLTQESMNMANNEKDFDEADWPDWIRWDLLEFKDSDSKELASSDTRRLQDEEDEYQEGHYHDCYDSENEATIKMTEEVLQRHRRKSPLPQPVHRSGKRGISPEPHYSPPKRSRRRRRKAVSKALIKGTQEVLQRHRRGAVRRAGRKQGRSTSRSSKAFSKHAAKTSRYANLDGKQKLTNVEVGELRYSQLSCKETFQCGRSVSQLVQDLLDAKVSLSEPFLRLTVFETTDEKTNEPILRCIDNRRLFALKEYAQKSGKDRVMVNVTLFSQDTVLAVQRYIHNSDETNGRHVQLRKNTGNPRR